MDTTHQFPQSHKHPTLSFTEKASIPLRFLLILLKAATYFATQIFRKSTINKATIRRLGLTAIAKKGPSLLTLRQIHAIQPTTGASIAKFCETKRLQHHIVRLEDTDGFPHASLHFIDCSPQDTGPILLYFHGGGFVFPIVNPAHLLFAREAAKNASAKLAILEYTLAPAVAYPGQLAQSAAALRFLLQQRDNDPSSIMVAGDSAGGNMAMALLAHLSEPHHLVSSVPLAAGKKLRAAFCVSTRLQNTFDSPSFRSNASKDLLAPALMKMMLENWKPAIDQVWTNPMARDAAFWKKVNAYRVLLLVGGDELYLDDNKDFARMVGADMDENAAWKLVVCPGENHDQAVNDMSLGIKDGVMFSEVMKWVQSV